MRALVPLHDFVVGLERDFALLQVGVEARRVGGLTNCGCVSADVGTWIRGLYLHYECR